MSNNVNESLIAQIEQKTASAVSTLSPEQLKRRGKAPLQADTIGKSAPSPKYETSAPKTSPVLIKPQQASKTPSYLRAEVAAFIAAFLADKSSVVLNTNSMSDWTKLINTSSKCAVATTNSLMKAQKIQLTQYNKLLSEEQHDEHLDKILGKWTLGLSIAVAVIAIGASLVSGGVSLASLGAFGATDVFTADAAVDVTVDVTVDATADTATDTSTESLGKRIVSGLSRFVVKYGPSMLMGGTLAFAANSPKLVEYFQDKSLSHALNLQANLQQQVGTIQASFSKQNEFLQYDGTQANIAGQFVQQMVQQLTGPVNNIGDVVHAFQSAVSKI